MELGSVLVALLCVGIPVGGVALIAVAIVVGARNARRRREGLAAYAVHREWDYAASDPSLVGRFGAAPFGRGHARSASNVLRGRHDGRHFVAFDYRYTTGSGDDSSTQTYSVVALHLGAVAPPLAVGPTTTLGRMWNSLTGRDVPIGHPAFDQAYTVHTPSPEFARDVLLGPVVDLMLARPGVAWRFDGDSMLMFRTGQHSPAEIEAKLELMQAILARVPDHVWSRLRGETPR